MPLNEQSKDLLFSNKGKPIVGLIHKEKKTIVLAPCIPQKIYLDLNDAGEALSGMFISDNDVAARPINEDELNYFNSLLKLNHVPRLAGTSNFDHKSSHEFLFEQKCNSTKQSEWGGFSVTLDFSGKLSYTFVSGAFNSPLGERIKGAELAQDLIYEVIKQISDVVIAPTDTAIASSSSPVKQSSFVTPEKKCKRTKYNHANLLSRSLFSTDVEVRVTPATQAKNTLSLTKN